VTLRGGAPGAFSVADHEPIPTSFETELEGPGLALQSARQRARSVSNVRNWDRVAWPRPCVAMRIHSAYRTRPRGAVGVAPNPNDPIARPFHRSLAIRLKYASACSR